MCAIFRVVVALRRFGSLLLGVSVHICDLRSHLSVSMHASLILAICHIVLCDSAHIIYTACSAHVRFGHNICTSRGLAANSWLALAQQCRGRKALALNVGCLTQ